MVLTFAQIQNLIIQNQYKACILYQGHLNIADLKGQATFEKIEATNHEMILGRLEEVKNTFGGNYTVCLGQVVGNSINWKHMQRFQASFTREITGATNDATPQDFSITDKATIIAEAKAEFRKEMKADADAKEIVDMKAELAHLKTFGGKAGLALDNQRCRSR